MLKHHARTVGHNNGLDFPGVVMHQIGMERQPLANSGAVVRVFVSGEAYHNGQAPEDPEQLRGWSRGPRVPSEIAVPLDVRGADNTSTTPFDNGATLHAPLIPGSLTHIECLTNQIVISDDHHRRRHC
jgi:hypothetical protein